MTFLCFVTFTFWNCYILKLLRLETITFSDATLSDINVLCHVLSQYHTTVTLTTKLSRHSGVSQTLSHSSSPTTASGKSISEACEPYMAKLSFFFLNVKYGSRSAEHQQWQKCCLQQEESVVVTLYQDFYSSSVKGTQAWNFFFWLFLQKPKTYGPNGL